MCYDILQREIPPESMSYLLLASLCGNFQHPNDSVPRYPTNLLTYLLLSLSGSGQSDVVDDFDRLQRYIDDFFVKYCDADMAAMIAQASTANRLALDSLQEWIADIERRGSVEIDDPAKRILRVFDNFCQVQAAFGPSLMRDPKRYLGAEYRIRAPALPSPVVFIEGRTGWPVSADFEEVHRIHTQRGVRVPPDSPYGKRYVDDNGVMRFAFVYSPRLERDLVARESFPEIDVALWEDVSRQLSLSFRFLLDGPGGLLDEVVEDILLEYALLGVKVYSVAGELRAPSIPDTDDIRFDPQRKGRFNARFLDASRELRDLKARWKNAFRDDADSNPC
jgi:hypothetical protein